MPHQLEIPQKSVKIFSSAEVVNHDYQSSRPHIFQLVCSRFTATLSVKCLRMLFVLLTTYCNLVMLYLCFYRHISQLQEDLEWYFVSHQL